MEKLTYKPVSHDHEEFLRESKKGEMFRKEYKALGPTYAITRELLLARKQSGLTQEAVARKIGTTKSAVSRLESAGKHVPSITTLRKYAEAVGCKLEIKLVPKQQDKSTVGFINNPEEEAFGSITVLAEEMQRLAELALRQYTPVVEGIISSESEDVHHIEHTLDGLLDFCFYDPMVELFRRLCRHYYFINPAAAASHVNNYREMWDSEDPEES